MEVQLAESDILERNYSDKNMHLSRLEARFPNRTSAHIPSFCSIFFFLCFCFLDLNKKVAFWWLTSFVKFLNTVLTQRLLYAYILDWECSVNSSHSYLFPGNIFSFFFFCNLIVESCIHTTLFVDDAIDMPTEHGIQQSAWLSTMASVMLTSLISWSTRLCE